MAGADAAQYVFGFVAVAILALNQVKGERGAINILHGINFGSRAAARTPYRSARTEDRLLKNPKSHGDELSETISALRIATSDRRISKMNYPKATMMKTRNPH
ncbi:MAG: hypothetical protein P4L87_25625 [Formivibrio sp.]|nr:hypothetical protein [Formivibrio sp.]